MNRISINVMLEEQRKLKALAALQRKSIKDNLIGAPDDKYHDSASQDLESLLDARAGASENGAISKRTVGDIFKAVYRESKSQ